LFDIAGTATKQTTTIFPDRNSHASTLCILKTLSLGTVKVKPKIAMPNVVHDAIIDEQVESQ
jgi:hypothetical protein